MPSDEAIHIINKVITVGKLGTEEDVTDRGNQVLLSALVVTRKLG